VKLFVVISSLHGGGAERNVAELANFWSKRGWDVCIATFTDASDADFYVVLPKVRRLHLGRDSLPRARWQKVRGNLRRLWALRCALRREQPQTILSFIDVNNVLTILASSGLGRRVVVSERIDPAANVSVGTVWQWARRVVYRYADVVVAQTHTAAQWLRTSCNADVVVIPNSLRALPAISARREALLISVGRLDVQKGYDVLLRAFARTRGTHPEWKLAILGEGPEFASLSQLRDELELGQVAHFHGLVRNVEDWYARAGLLVQASRFEGFPNVLLEAMGMGMAVISTACPSGPAELIDDGVNGRLVPVDDVQALAAAMSDLMRDDRERLRLGQAAVEVRSRFAPEHINAQWETILRGPV
jgi:GalNAc-alpha-(1->4)-GalNAc-alpha-(1->3)-diNAcBac-PP-undecaprenol alpha-1,4-N-acetyl-D-galactosaminyltransferase